MTVPVSPAFWPLGGWAFGQIKNLKYFDYDVNKKRVYRKKGEIYQMSPYELVYTDDNYYLVAYDSAKKRRNTFRVDRMASVAIVLMDREGQVVLAPYLRIIGFGGVQDFL